MRRHPRPLRPPQVWDIPAFGYEKKADIQALYAGESVAGSVFLYDWACGWGVVIPGIDSGDVFHGADGIPS